ncbi:MAG: hypothetical protein HRU75_06545 [Planctomycetia bacterium]|nr:MAG: hypothetical protein HRU75_06545 [Planctomycetia bacterium]
MEPGDLFADIDRRREAAIRVLCGLARMIGVLKGSHKFLSRFLHLRGEIIHAWVIEQPPFLTLEADPHQAVAGQLDVQMVGLGARHEPRRFELHRPDARHHPSQTDPRWRGRARFANDLVFFEAYISALWNAVNPDGIGPGEIRRTGLPF